MMDCWGDSEKTSRRRAESRLEQSLLPFEWLVEPVKNLLDAGLALTEQACSLRQCLYLPVPGAST